MNLVPVPVLLVALLASNLCNAQSNGALDPWPSFVPCELWCMPFGHLQSAGTQV